MPRSRWHSREHAMEALSTAEEALKILYSFLSPSITRWSASIGSTELEHRLVTGSSISGSCLWYQEINLKNDRMVGHWSSRCFHYNVKNDGELPLSWGVFYSSQLDSEHPGLLSLLLSMEFLK